MKLYDKVILKKDLSAEMEDGVIIPKGTEGMILEIFNDPEGAFVGTYYDFVIAKLEDIEPVKTESA